MYCKLDRLFQLSAVHGIQSAFDEAMSYCRYHPSKGYWWHFKDQEERGTDFATTLILHTVRNETDGVDLTCLQTEKAKPKSKKKEEPCSLFQRHRVDTLLVDLRSKFPPTFYQVSLLLKFFFH